MSEPQIIEIGLTKSDTSPKLTVTSNNDAGTLKLNSLPPLDTTSKKSVNFGPGVEMLMNQSKVSSSPKSDLPLSDINSLELNISEKPPVKKENANSVRNKIFGIGEPKSILKKPDISSEIKTNISEPILKKATEKDGNSTWDGFKKFNDIPVNPEAKPVARPTMTPQDLLKEKLLYLRRLESVEKKGVRLTKKYTMDSNLDEMKGEYEMIISEKEKGNSMKFQGKMLMAAVSAIEYLNGKFDPFDIKLDGWGESINENLEDYDEIFGELHEKYGGKAALAPELKLLFMLGGSAAMIHMTNTMFKSSIPGMDDIMRQNPELMQQFTQAAAQSMQQNNPGFSGFMNGAMGRGPPPMRMPPSMPPQNNRPPARMPPVGAYAPRGSPPGPPQNRRTNRPDLAAARGRPPAAKNPRKRPEMKGPGDINDILSGIKKKTVNIQSKKDSNSTISIDDLKELKSTDLDMPRKSARRKPKSARNTISLNI
uniref:Uncharacterized protein n=1 Tax=viral metagenome TaxID=1070528 RepID=A0A6C0BYN8_9ZZZZ